jgi:hypothetical protein
MVSRLLMQKTPELAGVYRYALAGADAHRDLDRLELHDD